MTGRYGTNYNGYSRQPDSEYWKNYSKNRMNNRGTGANGSYGVNDNVYGQPDSSYGANDNVYGQADGGYGANDNGYGQDYGSYGANNSGYSQSYGGYGANDSGYGQNYGSYETNDSAYEENKGNQEEMSAEKNDVISQEGYEQNRQTGSSFTVPGVLKCGMAFLILVYIALLLIYTSGSTKPFEEVSSAVEGLLDKENLVKQDARALKRYYGLNSADYEGFMYYSAEFSISALEVLLVEVKTDQQVQEVRDAVEERLESRRNTFEGYAPEQAQLIEQAQLLVRGRFIFLAVSPDAESYAAAFTNSL